jgi:hypothetical protein
MVLIAGLLSPKNDFRNESLKVDHWLWFSFSAASFAEFRVANAHKRMLKEYTLVSDVRPHKFFFVIVPRHRQKAD